MQESTAAAAVLHRQLAGGDPVALESLFQYARLLEVVLKRRFGSCIDDDDRRDIVADALIRAWQTGNRFDPALSSVKSWLIMLAVYQAREFLRRHYAGATIPVDAVETELATAEAVAGGQDEQPSTTIKRLLERLPRRRAQIIEMHYYQGRPVSEISRQLGITQNAVRSHLSHGHRSLRCEIETEQSAR